jgi:ribose-phosphate pyrophosphokinase
VDKVISLDLQRPGQGHEACFFDSSIPVETISSVSLFIDYFKDNVDLQSPVVVVAPNTEYVKKAKKFQAGLKSATGLESVKYGVFFNEEPPSSKSGQLNSATSELLADVKGADVIVIDDIVDTAGTLSILCRRLRKEGARRVFVCASHGLFFGNSMNLIDLSPVEKVVVSDSLPLPAVHSAKIGRVSVAELIARIITSESKNTDESDKRYAGEEDNEVFEVD